MMGILLQKGKFEQRFAHRKNSCDYNDRDWVKARSQGIPMIVSELPETKKDSWNIFFLLTQGRNQDYEHLEFRLPSSDTETINFYLNKKLDTQQNSIHYLSYKNYATSTLSHICLFLYECFELLDFDSSSGFLTKMNYIYLKCIYIYNIMYK
jgi:hypothetical protein